MGLAPFARRSHDGVSQNANTFRRGHEAALCGPAVADFDGAVARDQCPAASPRIRATVSGTSSHAALSAAKRWRR